MGAGMGGGGRGGGGKSGKGGPEEYEAWKKSMNIKDPGKADIDFDKDITGKDPKLTGLGGPSGKSGSGGGGGTRKDEEENKK